MSKKFANLTAFGLVSGLIVVLAGCASEPAYVPPPAPMPVPARPKPVAPVMHVPTPAPTLEVVPAPPANMSYKPMANDQCGANALQGLVGKPRTDIPIPLDPAARRVICSTCVTTQEYRSDRQTIIFDTDSGLIKSVSCG